MIVKKLLLLAMPISLSLLLANPAQARWRVAQSEHFVIYANDSARDLQRFSEMLERYHVGLELATGRQMDTPSPSNRLTVFAVGDQGDIAELMGTESRWLGGFYVPRASGSVAFVQNVRPSNRTTDFSMIVLLHEYAHHFFAMTSPFAMPSWMNEGSAEFYASARFPSSGDLEIGRPARHRGYELNFAEEVPLRQLLTYDTAGVPREGDAFYGRSWLLFHYLQMERSRAGQLNAYILALADGQPPLEAGESAFGNLDQLESELNEYQRRRRMEYFTIASQHIRMGNAEVRELSDGMDELMPLLIQFKRGASEEQARALVSQVRDIAARYPQDAEVLSALAEAEFASGNDHAAIAAADRALALDTSLANAYVQKGYALFRLAEKSGSLEDFDRAMEPFEVLNALESDHPIPLIYLYRRYVAQGAQPSPLARDGLLRALDIAPFDFGLRFQVVDMLARQGNLTLARRMLQPILAHPHDESIREVGRQLAQSLAAGRQPRVMRVQLHREGSDGDLDPVSE